MIPLPHLLQLKYGDIDFIHEVQLRDYGKGNGPEICYWGRVEPQPTKEDFERWSKEFDLEYRQKLAIERRAYPPVEEQLDLLYKAMKAGEIPTALEFVTAIDLVKNLNPKPSI